LHRRSNPLFLQCLETPPLGKNLKTSEYYGSHAAVHVEQQAFTHSVKDISKN